MSFKITDKQCEGFYFIEVKGAINNKFEHKTLFKDLYESIETSGSKVILIDESEFSIPPDIFNQLDMVDFMERALPYELRFYKIAVLVAIADQKVAKFWETASYNRGYTSFKVFVDSEKAENWLLDVN
jgi:hypothetical protein